MDLNDYEPLIKSVARRYAKGNENLDDLEQLGRMAVWETLSKDPNAETSHLVVAIKSKIFNLYRSERAQKRRPPGGIVSIHTPLTDDGSFTMEDTIADPNNFEPDLSSPEELAGSLMDDLRKRYGYFYIKEMRESEKQPRALVRKIIRTVIEDVYEISTDKIPRTVDYKFFIKSGLGSLLWVFYRNSSFDAVNDAFRGEFLPWEFKKVPNRFWKGKRGYDRSLEAIAWFTNLNEIETSEDCRKIKTEDFVIAGLSTVLQKHFNSSPFLALKTRFPELKPWQARRTPKGYFDDEKNQIEAVSSFLLESNIPLIWNFTAEETYDTGIRKVVTKDAMEKYGLRGLMAKFNNSTYGLYSTLFPEQILPWTLSSSKEPWRENPVETASKAIKWLFDDYLQIPVEEIREYATCKLFWRVGFSGILTNRHIGFNSSPYAAVDSAYPGKFLKDEFDRKRKISSISKKNLKKDRKLNKP